MKIFYIGPRRTPDLTYVNDKVIELLESAGHRIDKSLINQKYSYDIIHFEDAYKRNLNSIKSCDLLIIEVTETSTSSGFVISYALSEKKPVLALINPDKNKSLPITLKGSTNKLFTLKEYTDKNLKEILTDYLVTVKAIMDTKFILIISPEIDRYLQWVSENRRMHKAQIVRLALEEAMEKDKEYGKMLKKG